MVRDLGVYKKTSHLSIFDVAFPQTLRAGQYDALKPIQTFAQLL